MGEEWEGQGVMGWEGPHFMCGVAGMPYAGQWAGGAPPGESMNTGDRGGMEGCECGHG